MTTARADHVSYSPQSNRPLQSNASQDDSSAEGPTTTRADLATIRVLVIDDDRTLREGCASVLQVEGYNVTSCGRGDEAIDLVRRSQFDVVLVDLYMTPVSGMEILKAVLGARPETIVVMMT